MSFRIMPGRLLIFIMFLCLAGSCRRNPENREVRTKPNADEMTGLNSYLVQKDREIIGNYIERKHLGMTETPTGLWYLIKNEGSGEYLKDNDRIRLNYRCELIDGTLCYTSDDLGPRQVIIGKTDIEPGLNEGLRLLKPGGEALFILPPYLGHGLVGDGNKIPPRTIIVYHVAVLNRE